MVLIRPLISKSSSPCTNPLVVVPRAAIRIGITVTFMFHGFFQFLSKARYFSFFSLSFSFTLCSVGTPKSIIRKVLFFFFFPFFFFFCWISLGLVVWPKFGNPFLSQNPSEVCVSHSPGQIPGCAYTICSLAQVSISCTITSRLPCPSCRV